jgi:hypothetical protein
MVSVLATKPKVRPAEDDEFLRAIKIRSTQSHFVRLYGMLKNHSKHEIDIRRLNLPFLSPVHSALILDDSAGKRSRELWWTNWEFSRVNIIVQWFSMLIYHLGDER